jgi:hypothetical protein
MNNEVLRRKLFRTVLADSRSPAGILASSPEMVDTVQRRANGGISDRRKIAGQQFARLSAGLPEGTEKPESYLQVLARIKNLPTQQQAEELMKAGFGATIGPDVPAAIGATTDEVSRRAGIAGQIISEDLSEVFGPDADKGIREGLRSGFQSIKNATGLDYSVGEEGGLGSLLTAGTGKTRAQLLEEEASAAADIAGSPMVGADRPAVDDDLEANMAGDMAGDIPPTVAEEVSQAAVSGADTQTIIKPKIDDAAAPKTDLDPDNNLSNFSAQLDSAKTTSEVSKITAPKIKAEDFVGEKEKVGESWTKFIDKSFKPTDRVTFSDMEEKAKELMDFDPEAVEADKKSAFFMNLMKAGLAIAAGESDNLVTNLAKGLGVGLEGYGKDLNRISADEKEKRKEYRATVMKMVDDENDFQVAMDGLKVQVDLGMARLAQADNNARQQRNLARDTAELSAAQAEAQMGLQADIGNARNDLAAASNALQFKTLELSHFKAMTDLGYKEQALDEQKRSNVANESLKRYTAELAGMSKEQIQVMGLGSDFAVLNNDGTFKEFTPEGEKLYTTLITASSTTKSSITDLVRTSNAHAVNGNILGVPLSSSPVIAQQQGLVWESTFKENYSKALEDGNEDLAESILGDFQASIGVQAQPTQETSTGFKVKR